MADPDLFFTRTGMDRAKVQQTVDDALTGSDDGELRPGTQPVRFRSPLTMAG